MIDRSRLSSRGQCRSIRVKDRLYSVSRSTLARSSRRVCAAVFRNADFTDRFDLGQSYVALSRAASMDGLQVLRFDPRKVMAHPRVIEWSKTLA